MSQIAPTRCKIFPIQLNKCLLLFLPGPHQDPRQKKLKGIAHKLSNGFRLYTDFVWKEVLTKHKKIIMQILYRLQPSTSEQRKGFQKIDKWEELSILRPEDKEKERKGGQGRQGRNTDKADKGVKDQATPLSSPLPSLPCQSFATPPLSLVTRILEVLTRGISTISLSTIVEEGAR